MEDDKNNKGRKKDLPTNYIRMNWDPKPGQPNIKRLSKLMSITNNKQQKELEKLTEINTDSISNMSTIYVYDNKNNKWEIAGQRCMDCGKVMSKKEIIIKHTSICDKSIVINKDEEYKILNLLRKNNNANTESNAKR